MYESLERNTTQEKWSPRNQAKDFKWIEIVKLLHINELKTKNEVPKMELVALSWIINGNGIIKICANCMFVTVQ